MRKCRAAIRMTNCNTGSGAIRASSCTLTCDIGCNGSLTVPCNAYGGTFTISGTGCQDQRAPWQLNWICDNKLQYGIRSHSSKQLHSDLRYWLQWIPYCSVQRKWKHLHHLRNWLPGPKCTLVNSTGYVIQIAKPDQEPLEQAAAL